ncbi:hypothetical protein HDU97_009402 [Phlyctochytrium planicorne]|nr:hypothetical protein HDU97_009402 [Phlyctochytrium planicorne]
MPDVVGQITKWNLCGEVIGRVDERQDQQQQHERKDGPLTLLRRKEEDVEQEQQAEDVEQEQQAKDGGGGGGDGGDVEDDVLFDWGNVELMVNADGGCEDAGMMMKSLESGAVGGAGAAGGEAGLVFSSGAAAGGGIGRKRQRDCSLASTFPSSSCVGASGGVEGSTSMQQQQQQHQQPQQFPQQRGDCGGEEGDMARSSLLRQTPLRTPSLTDSTNTQARSTTSSTGAATGAASSSKQTCGSEDDDADRYLQFSNGDEPQESRGLLNQREAGGIPKGNTGRKQSGEVVVLGRKRGRPRKEEGSPVSPLKVRRKMKTEGSASPRREISGLGGELKASPGAMDGLMMMGLSGGAERARLGSHETRHPVNSWSGSFHSFGGGGEGGYSYPHQRSTTFPQDAGVVPATFARQQHQPEQQDAVMAAAAGGYAREFYRMAYNQHHPQLEHPLHQRQPYLQQGGQESFQADPRQIYVPSTLAAGPGCPPFQHLQQQQFQQPTPPTYWSNPSASSTVTLPPLPSHSSPTVTTQRNRARSGSHKAESEDGVLSEPDHEKEEMDKAQIKRKRNTDSARRSRLKRSLRLEELERQCKQLEESDREKSVKLAVMEKENAFLVGRERELVERVRCLEGLLEESRRGLMEVVRAGRRGLGGGPQGGGGQGGHDGQALVGANMLNSKNAS